MRLRLAALTATLAALCAALAMTVAADSTSPYRQAIADALQVVAGAQPGDGQAAREAYSILKSGTGDSQPEVLADLTASPPKLTDATSRLRAILDALDRPAATSDPAAAQAKLHDVLSMQRYDALHRPPTALERFEQWVRDRISDFLRYFFGRNGVGGHVPVWALYVFGAVVLAIVALVVVLSARGRLSSDLDALSPGAPRPPADWFIEADRLAARGDRVGAIRALCAAVAATLAGELTWEGSPLTVREIFNRSDDPASLRPLLLPFEAAVYGGRDVDAATYERASEVASKYRAPVEVAA